MKIPVLVAGMVAGADSIEDMDLLRHGGMGRLFGGDRDEDHLYLLDRATGRTRHVPEQPEQAYLLRDEQLSDDGSRLARERQWDCTSGCGEGSVYAEDRVSGRTNGFGNGSWTT